MTDIQRAMLGDHEAAARLTEQGVLIPCPYCEGTDIMESTCSLGIWYFCVADGCEAMGPNAASEKEARLAWNTRAPLLTPEQIERLEKAE